MKSILQASAVQYLRYESGCSLVSLERSPWNNDPCVPDVIGIDKKRQVREIEIKTSWSDFRKNRQKDSMFRRRFLGIAPASFHFLVPQSLVERVRGALEVGEGLMSIDTSLNVYTGIPKLYVVVKAPFNQTQKLSLKQMVRMSRQQTGTLVTTLAKLAKLHAAQEESVDYDI